MKITLLCLSILSLFAAVTVFGEVPQPTGPQPQSYQDPQYQQAAPEGYPQAYPGQYPQAPQPQQQEVSVLDQLKRKLTNEKGEPANLVILDPLDYTGVKLADNVKKILERGFTRFAKVNLIQTRYALDELTLESFRNAVIATNSDIMVATVLKPNGFEIFLYDIRNPFVIFTYAHTLPDPRVHQYSKRVIIRHTKQLIARLLNNYVKDIHYELPRAERSIASYEGNLGPDSVPRGPAATQMYFAANRERSAKYYVSASMGYFLSKGANGAFNSSMFSGQFGWNFSGPLVAEVSIDMASYNIASLSLKYFGQKETSHWRYFLGFGLGYATAKFTANWDQTNGIGFTSLYAIPSGAVFLPVSRTAYLKAEARLYIGIPPSRLLFAVMPGLVFRF